MPAMDYAKIARLYDIYAHTDIDVPFFVEQAQGCQNVLELTSGTGRLSIPLIAAGVNLYCLDSSHEMLEILQRKLQAQGLFAPVYEMDVCEFSIPEKFDLILFPFNSFSEIPDAAQQGRALQSIRLHLGDGGKFICTLHNPAVRLKQVDGQTRLRGRFPVPEGGALALYSCEHYDPATGLVSGEQIYELSDMDGKIEEKFSIALCFMLHSKESFENLLRSQGFVVMDLFGDYSCSAYHAEESPFMIWVLE